METGLLAWIAIGIAVGVLARLLPSARDPGGMIVTILIGTAGALFAGYLGHVANLYAPGQALGMLAAVAGAVALLLVYRAVLRRRS